jgi:glutamate/tyrosine decarboxylase-like PLP-dependent enzyme
VAHRTDAFSSFGELEVTTATGERAPLDALSTFRLSNLPIDTITDLHLRIKASLGDGETEQAQAFQDALPSVRKAGLASFLLQYNEAFPNDRARLPKVLISQATHYCWQKNMDLVGLGADALETLPVDDRIRLDTDALRERLHECRKNEQPVLGVISIVGTTEEGAIDPVHEIEAVREAVGDAGLTFWHHCDAAFGGYFTSLLPKTDDGAFVPPSDLNGDLAGPDGLLPTDDVEALTAVGDTDSLTVDPHKFGYVPYPAGAVLFRDYHVRDAIAYKAPYLADNDSAGFGGFLGQWTLEGSRPGATAVSCYLSQELVPLTPEGHGRFMRNCIEANQALVSALDDRFADTRSELSLRPFHPPETVAYCFVLAPDTEIESIEALNEFTNRIWQRMTVDGRENINQYSFLLSRTEIKVEPYEHVLRNILNEEVLAEAVDDGASLTLLRTCLMNPFQADWNAEDPSFAERLADVLYDVAADEYLEQMLPSVPRPGTERQPILVVEQSPRAQDSLARHLEHDEKVVAHFDVRSCSTADLHASDDRLTAAASIVVHLNAGAPDRMVHLLRQLVEEHDVDPARLTTVVNAPSSGLPVTDRLTDLGLPARNVISEHDRSTGARRLMMRLSTLRATSQL